MTKQQKVKAMKTTLKILSEMDGKVLHYPIRTRELIKVSKYISRLEKYRQNRYYLR